MSKSNYEVEFQNAIQRTKDWGLNAPLFKPSERRFFNDKGLRKLNTLLQDSLGKMHPKEVSQQCFAINYSMQEQLEALLGTDLTYTLGYVEYNQRNVFYTPEDELEALLGTPVSMRPINLHAWLTSPSYEIIDLTFGTTYGVVNNDPRCYGLMCAQHHSLFTKDFIHHPQVVGDDFLSAIGGILQVNWG